MSPLVNKVKQMCHQWPYNPKRRVFDTSNQLLRLDIKRFKNASYVIFSMDGPFCLYVARWYQTLWVSRERGQSRPLMSQSMQIIAAKPLIAVIANLLTVGGRINHRHSPCGSHARQIVTLANAAPPLLSLREKGQMRRRLHHVMSSPPRDNSVSSEPQFPNWNGFHPQKRLGGRKRFPRCLVRRLMRQNEMWQIKWMFEMKRVWLRVLMNEISERHYGFKRSNTEWQPGFAFYKMMLVKTSGFSVSTQILRLSRNIIIRLSSQIESINQLSYPELPQKSYHDHHVVDLETFAML